MPVQHLEEDTCTPIAQTDVFEYIVIQ